MKNKRIITIFLLAILIINTMPIKEVNSSPLALTPVVKYGIGSMLVAGGVYANNKESLDYAINDYWNKASLDIKERWTIATIVSSGVGRIFVDNVMNSDFIQYIQNKFNSGENTLKTDELGQVVDMIPGEYYDVVYYNDGSGRYNESFYDGTNVGWITYPEGSIYVARKFPYIYKDDISHYVDTLGFTINNDGRISFRYQAFSEKTNNIYTNGVGVSGAGYLTASKYITHSYLGDSGIGLKLGGKKYSIPAPPVHPDVWEDNWIDELEKELNRRDNPFIEEQTLLEEWEHDFDWYIDKDGNLYRKKKGEPPKKEDDTKLVPPFPIWPDNPYVPEVPDINNPDETTIDYPPHIDIKEHPDGSRTETITEKQDKIQRYFDPEQNRWVERKTTTETKTTIDYSPDGQEIGRTVTTTTSPPTTTTTTPPFDDTIINWEPLKQLPEIFIWKFPFSLPWDLKRGIESLVASEWDRKITINIGDGIWPPMEIDLSMFDNIASIARIVFLIVFDFGLIFSTRRLMGGDV